MVKCKNCKFRCPDCFECDSWAVFWEKGIDVVTNIATDYEIDVECEYFEEKVDE